MLTLKPYLLDIIPVVLLTYRKICPVITLTGHQRTDRITITGAGTAMLYGKALDFIVAEKLLKDHLRLRPAIGGLAPGYRQRHRIVEMPGDPCYIPIGNGASDLVNDPLPVTEQDTDHKGKRQVDPFKKLVHG